MSVISNGLTEVSSSVKSTIFDATAISTSTVNTETIDLKMVGDAQSLLRKIQHSSLAQVGNTPLIKLNEVTAHLPDTVSIYAKAEHLNPSGSVKDRAGLRIITEAIRSGELNKDITLIDSTSGNTGIAYAMIGAALGIPVEIAMSEGASEERKRILRSYGATLRLTDADLGSDGAQQYVLDKMKTNPSGYFYANQYNNDANWRAHFEGTAPEIIEQTDGGVTHFVAGVGTSGTFVGVARRLKAFSAEIQCISVQPDVTKHSMKGLRHLASAKIPGIYDQDTVDAELACSSEEAIEMTRRLAREEGILVGISSGANVHASLKLAERLGEGNIVTILCDNGNRYLSHNWWV